MLLTPTSAAAEIRRSRLFIALSLTDFTTPAAQQLTLTITEKMTPSPTLYLKWNGSAHNGSSLKQPVVTDAGTVIV
jgi:hypothetical protein